MQHTALPGRDATSGTGDGGYLFGREFGLPHCHRMRLHSVVNLYKIGHCLVLDAYTPIPDLSSNPTSHPPPANFQIEQPILATQTDLV
jgi:hypothetical protein